MTDKKTQPQPKPSRSKLTWLALLIAVFALLASGYTLKMTLENTAAVAKVRQSALSNYERSHNLEMALATINEAHASLQNELSQLLNQINMASPTPNSSLLSAKQALHYLELARIEEKLGHSEITCALLIKQARKLVTNIHDTKLTPIIETLSSALAQLENTSALDMQTVLHQFHGLETQLMTLSSLPPASQGLEENKSFDKLKGLVVIKRRAHPCTEPGLDSSTLINRIMMNLQAAKLALLQHNEKLYEIAMKHAIEDTEQAFSGNEKEKTALIESLESLAKLNVNPALPSLEAPIEALSTWINTNTQHEKQASPS